MTRFFQTCSLPLLATLITLLLIAPPSWVDARTQNVRTNSVRLVRREPPPQKPQLTMNAWTVGLAGGLLEAAPIRLAADPFDLHVVRALCSFLTLYAGIGRRGFPRRPR